MDGRYLAARRGRTGALTPSIPTSIKQREERVLRPEIGICRLVPFVERVPVAAFAAAADGDRRDTERHGEVGVGARPREHDVRPACDRRRRPPRRLDQRRILGDHAGRTLADQVDLDGDPVGAPPLVFFRRGLADEREHPRLELQQLLGRVRTQVDGHVRLAGNGVDRRAAAHRADRECRLRLGRRFEVGDSGDRASHGVYGARQAEFLKAVAARSAEDHLVAKASGRAIDHAGDAEAVDRDEAVDVAVVAEQRLDAA